MIIYNKHLVPAGFSGITVWPFIFIDEKFKDNAALLAHEMVHYREQAWLTPIWWTRYWLSVTFRVAAEVRAYKAQLAAGGLGLQSAALWLMKYDPAMTHESAIKKLTD